MQTTQSPPATRPADADGATPAAVRARKRSRNRLIVIGGVVVLLVLMVLNTQFLTPAEVAKAGPQQFDPAAAAADLFGKAQSELPGEAAALTDVLPAVQKDTKGAAATFKAVSPAENSYVFAVKATGTVAAESTADLLRLTVDGATGSTVLIPLTTAINGTVLRDAMGFKFGDAPGQTEYQYVGDELKKLIQSKVVAPLGDPSSLKGKKITVTGVVSVLGLAGVNTVPAAKPTNVQPVVIQVAA